MSTTINGGTLRAAVSNVLPAGSSLTVDANGIFSLNGFNQTLGSLSGSSNSSVTMGSGNLTLGSNNLSTIYAGTISGTGSLNYNSTSAGFTLAGNNTYSGTTVASGNGTLIVPASSSAGPLLVQKGTVRLAGATQTNITTFNKTNNIYTSLNEQFPSTGVGIPGSNIGLANSAMYFDPSAGAVAAGGYAQNYISGSNLVNNGVAFELTSDARGYDYSEIAPGTQSTIPVNVLNVSRVYLLIGAYVQNGLPPTTTITLTGANGATQVFNNVMFPDFAGGSINTALGGLVEQTVFQVHNLGSGGTGNSVTGSFNNYDMTEISLTVSSALSSQQLTSITIGSNGFEPLLFGITVTQPVATPVIATVSVNSGATFDINNSNLSIGSLSGGGTVALGTGQLTTGSDNTNSQFDGSITGTGGLTKVGSGILTLTGANTCSGATVISGGQLVLSLPSGSLASASITIAAGASLNVNVNAGLNSSAAMVCNGNVSFAPNSGNGILIRTLASLSIGAGGRVNVMQAPDHKARTDFVIGGLNLAGSASTGWLGGLDLANNDLDVQNGSLSTLTGEVAGGYNNGTWTGTGGIFSSTAATDPTHLTALGVIQNSIDGSLLGSPLYGSNTSLGTFDGTSPGSNNVLIKFTYYGDTNLDGQIDGTDYSRIDNASINHLTGWFNGDFNFDSPVNGSDYTLLDNAFNRQGPNLATAAALVAPAAINSGAVPTNHGNKLTSAASQPMSKQLSAFVPDRFASKALGSGANFSQGPHITFASLIDGVPDALDKIASTGAGASYLLGIVG